MDADKNVILKVKAPCCTCSCCSDVKFEVCVITNLAFTAMNYNYSASVHSIITQHMWTLECPYQ